MLLDTSVIPVFYHGTYTIPLTLVVVLCISLLMGRMFGLFFGMIGGLLIDITAGSLGVMTFYFMVAGFLMGLIVDEKADSPITGVPFHLRRGGVAFILSMLGEIVIAVYHYFVTAAFDWSLALSMLLRAGLMAALTMLFCPLLNRLFVGKKHRRTASRTYAGKKREVKHF